MDKPLPAGMETAIESLREQLLDISKRNRLTNTPVGKRRVNQLEIEDERSDEVFRILYRERRTMTFEAYRGSQDQDSGPRNGEDRDGHVFVPSGDPVESEAAEHHRDRKLQTRLAAETLQKRLLKLYRDARGVEEEQGVSVLFLALGFLRWHESESSEIERFAPLVLLPVDLERDSARGRFRLRFRDEDLEANLSLGAMLRNDFGLTLPGFSEEKEWLPSEYFARTREAVSSRPRWQVQANVIVLGFYSFAKFLMWRDLAPDNEWGAEDGSNGESLVQNLLLGGFGSAPIVADAAENLDQRFPDPRELGHVLDADTSQTRVIAAVRDGRNLVVQGPPGTGKSQTIANIIAVAARDGKRVLFVAEKRAALDVVHARLEARGLGPLCIELHSHKAVRRHVYEDLKKTLELGRPTAVDTPSYERVREVRDELNRVSGLLHRVDPATGETPYRVIGLLSRLAETGFSRPEFHIEGASRWSRDEFAERRRAVDALADLTAAHGGEARHVWRGARRRLTFIDAQALSERIDDARQRLQAVMEAVPSAARAVGFEEPRTLSAVGLVAGRLEAFAEAPNMAPRLLRQDAVVDDPGAARDLVLRLWDDLEKLEQLESRLSSQVVEAALDADWTQTRLAISAHGASPLRWLKGGYREAVARLKGVQRAGLPKALGERLQLLDRLIEHAKRKRAAERDDRLGASTVGDAWRGRDTRMAELRQALSWIEAQTQAAGSALAVRNWFEAVPKELDSQAMAQALRAVEREWRHAWERVDELVDLDAETAFGTALDAVDAEVVADRLAGWLAGLDSHDGWHSLAAAGNHASALGLGELRERLAQGRLEPETARGTFELVRAWAVWQRLLAETPELGSVDGAKRSANVETFKELDRQLQELSAQEAALRHFDRLPPGSSGQIGIVRGEINKKRRHMRLRKLLDKAGEAVAAIKPVFLMSPLSVAQFLRPGGLTFDVLLIDEASQVRPADAMGAVLRARQIVVVGDQKQLPPTSFFDRQVSGEEELDYEDVADIQASQAGDMESILSLCDARAMAGMMLKWHYRSVHPSLIEVSNHEFYDDGLVCPPSPDRVVEELGLSLVPVDGRYDRGRRRNNPDEAQAVANEVLAHARARPDLSLGVVALSVSQRDTIRDRIEYMRTEHPELDAFCREREQEAFFVKNLENVQGDERDVVFISIGYGRDEGGYMAQSFGPVSAVGGERRLNVLFTRARRTCRVFSSIRHGDIRLDAVRHRGPKVLKRFLKYAETGDLDIPVPTGGEFDSPFEEAVAKALQTHGYRVVGQVGSAGFRIDLAVHDPDDEGRFLLAVECDGARYHSSSWARERDRLRQAVLEQKGWTFHRIWSTDWFYNREVELQKLLAAVERARLDRGSRASSPGAGPGETRRPRPSVERVPQPPAPDRPRVAYKEAAFDIPLVGSVDLHEAPLERLAECVVRIVEIEEPVHVDEVARRLSRLWGYQRAGGRIQECVQRAARAAIQDGRLHEDPSPETPGFLALQADRMPAARDRGAVDSPTLRKVDMLPPREVQAAILQAVERNVGIDGSECAVEVARALGFKATSQALRNCVSRNAKRLIAEGTLAVQGGQLRLPPVRPPQGEAQSPDPGSGP